MKEFITYIVKNIVDQPDQVKVEAIQGHNTMIIEVKVAKVDTGKVIGRQGKTIQAIRALVVAVASRAGVRVTLEVLEADAPSPVHTTV
jgi:predicted RNA-binding protein YlqC (UPF0109 family)